MNTLNEAHVLTDDQQALVAAIAEAAGIAVREAMKPFSEVPARKTVPIGDPAPSQASHIEVRTIAPEEKPEKGIRFARTIRALASNRGDMRAAAHHAEHIYHDSVVAKALSEGVNTAGGYLVKPEFSNEIIELLRPASVVRRAGARSIPMNSNTLNIPRLTAGSSAAYVGENQNIQTTQPQFGNLVLSAKKLAAVIPMSNELIRDNAYAADQVVRDDVIMALSLKEDITFIRSAGSASEPTGLRFQTSAGNIFAAAGAITLANQVADLGKMRRLVVAANARFVKPGFLISARTEGSLMTTLDAQGKFVFRDEMQNGRLMTFPYYLSNQIPENLGSGSDESEVYFGDFNEALIGENQDIMIDISTEAAYSSGGQVVAAFSMDQTVLRILTRHDFGLRQQAAFSVLTGVRWGV